MTAYSLLNYLMCIVDRVSRTGGKSLALSVSLQDPHGTLDDQAIQELVDQVVCVLRKNADAELRG